VDGFGEVLPVTGRCGIESSCLSSRHRSGQDWFGWSNLSSWCFCCDGVCDWANGEDLNLPPKSIFLVRCAEWWPLEEARWREGKVVWFTALFAIFGSVGWPNGGEETI